MNNDFPRMLALLRKEKKLSQKQASIDLGIAQALLSHYEKGKRECGLDFLIKAADYYNVSADFLLGRSAARDGTFVSEEELDSTETKRSYKDPAELSTVFTKKLLISSIEVVFSLLARVKNQKLTQSVVSMFLLTVYRVFRLVHKTNVQNPGNLFGIIEEMAFRGASAQIDIAEGEAILAITHDKSEAVEITTMTLEREYQKPGTALLSLIKNCESIIKPLIK